MKIFRFSLQSSVVLVLFLMISSAYAANFIVDNPGDGDNGSAYVAGDGNNTLRKCIRLANSASGADNITFNVSGIISPASALPAVTDNGTVIDASSRWNGVWPGGKPGIVIDGSGAGGVSGLTFTGVSNCKVRGLFIKGLQSNIYDEISSIKINGNSSSNIIGGTVPGYRNVLSGSNYGLIISDSDDNIVSGNYFGTDVNGTGTLENRQSGILIAEGSKQNVVGGTTDDRRNIISGNNHNGVAIVDKGTDNNKVLGNYIGTNPSGIVGLSNEFGSGVVIGNGAKSNIIGGTTPGERNIISANGNNGITIWGLGTNGNQVTGNFIGTDATGTADMGNAYAGVQINSKAQSNIIGGTTDGERNIISGNDGDGVGINGANTNNNVVLGNYIGVDVNCVNPLPNEGNGVTIVAGAQLNIIGGIAQAPFNTIDAVAVGKGNVISGNKGQGVNIDGNGTDNNKVSGNYIGTNDGGTAIIGNLGNGVHIWGKAKSNNIGGTTVGERNIISGNKANGVDISDAGTNNNKVLGNHIGTDINGANALGNILVGVQISNGAQFNIIGGATAAERNVISGNSSHGIMISATNNNVVAGNYIGTNANGNAELANTYSGVRIKSASQSNTIGGTNEGDRNIISGNLGNGIDIAGTGTNNNKILGNYIGANVNGTASLENQRSGVLIGDSAKLNIIGGTNPGERNIISGNKENGVQITDQLTNENKVVGNYIGTDKNGVANLKNSLQGVHILGNAQSNITAENIIAFNEQNGVLVAGNQTVSNKITKNSIHNNVKLGIDLVNGGNNEIPAPNITSAGLKDDILAISGTGAGDGATVEIFEADSPNSEGMTYLGSLVSAANGNFFGQLNVSGMGISIGDPLVATTTTKAFNDTSEFSNVVIVVEAQLCQRCELQEGWNLISFSVNKCFYYGDEPDDQPECVETVDVTSLGFNSLAEWFDSVIIPNNVIDKSWRMVIGINGAMDFDLLPVYHSLKYMSPCSGYWVKINDGTGGAHICLDGQLFNLTCPITLEAGWNLCGYPSTVGYYDTNDEPSVPGVTNWEKVPPPVANYVFKSIAGEFTMIIGEDGAYDPSLPPSYSSLHYIAPCSALWIKMKTASDLIYSEAGH